MPDADFSGVLKPKRVVDRRLREAEEEGVNVGAGPSRAPPVEATTGAGPSRASGTTMSQADFLYGRQKTPEDRLAEQKKLAEILKNRK